jgi:lysine 6-dehydrogenase
VVLTRTTITGEKNGIKLKHIYQMIDLLDPNTGYSAMARTTSFPTSIIGQLVADRTISTKGVVYAEEVVPATNLLEELKKRNIKFDFSEAVIDE